MQWVFLGCPGVLSRLLGVPHIAMGDLVRDELASTGPLAAQVRVRHLSVPPGSRSAPFWSALIWISFVVVWISDMVELI